VNNERKSVAGARWKWGVAAILVGVAVVLAIHFRLAALVQGVLKSALDGIAQLGFWAPLLFIVLYVVSCVALLPASLLTLGAGAVFGIVKGSIYVSIGATLGATAAFLVGRYYARAWVTRRLEAHPRFVAVERAVSAEGWRIVLLTRLSPIFPFFLLNYAYGLTRVPLRQYVLATWVGIIPGTTLFVYIGSLANPSGGANSVAAWAVRFTGLIATVLVTVYLSRIARRALSKKIPIPTGASKGED
jgi:uncharacterized membrane protein YdjX (TVP38/TMEM64 family)